MKEKKRKRYSFSNSLVLILLVVLVDLVLQFQSHLNGWGVANEGISFGLGTGISLVIRICLGILLFGFGFWLFFINKKLNLYLLAVFVGGSANFLARLYFGYVWDYVELPGLGIWINFSDILIASGAVSYILVGNDSNRERNKDS